MKKVSPLWSLAIAFAGTGIGSLFVPLAGPMAGGLTAGLLGRHPYTPGWSGLGCSLAWMMLWMGHSWLIGEPAFLIMQQVSDIIGLPSGWILIPGSGLVAGVTGGMAAWAGRSWHR